MIVPESVWNVGALLGEGPAWFADDGLLRFVDIEGGKLHRFDPASGARETQDVGGKPSFVVPDADGGLIVGSGDSLYRMQPGGFGERIATVDQPARNRTNDATVDARGRLWFGTMDDDQTLPTGTLHCLDRGVVHRIGGDAVVTNGPAVTGDCRTLYHVDSAARTIWRFALGDDLEIVERSIFLQLEEADGHPDGVVLDAEECLWVALWDGWGLRRYSPAGEKMLHIHFPCARVTKLAFGGADFRTGYVTTARTGLDEAALAGQPLAGSLFAFDAPVAGRPLPAVRLQ